MGLIRNYVATASRARLFAFVFVFVFLTAPHFLLPTSRLWAASQWTQTTDADFAGGLFNMTVTSGTGTGAQIVLSPFGNGADGNVTISATKNINTDTISGGRTYADGINYAISAIYISSVQCSATPNGIVAGDEIVLINQQGDSTNYGNVGNYEFFRIAGVSGNFLIFTSSITKIYGATSSNSNLTGQKVTTQRVPNWGNVTINSPGILTCSAWDGTKGGMVVFRSTGTVSVASGASIDTIAKGFRGGLHSGVYDDGNQIATSASATQTGEGIGGRHHSIGGGSGGTHNNVGCGGAGGSHGGYGQTGSTHNWTATQGGDAGGSPGSTYGTTELTKIFFGSGGGAGGNDQSAMAGDGGAGGGIIIIVAEKITKEGGINSEGGVGDPPISDIEQWGGSGGGSGGSVYLSAKVLDAKNFISVNGGDGSRGVEDFNNPDGGDGGQGRIYLECEIYTSLNNTIDIASAKNINMDIIESGRSYADGVIYPVNAVYVSSVNCSATPNGIVAGDEVLLISVRGSTNSFRNVGRYEFKEVKSVSGNNIVFKNKIKETYGAVYKNDTLTDQKVIVQRIPIWGDTSINAELTCSGWDGIKGGILAFRSNGSVIIGGGGSVNVTGKGYRRPPNQPDNGDGYPGEGTHGDWVNKQGINIPNGSGGGGGDHAFGGAGGGGHAVAGQNGAYGSGGSGDGGYSNEYGLGGIAVGTSSLKAIFMGGAGGIGGDNDSSTRGTTGSSGGGIIIIQGDMLDLRNIEAQGLDGATSQTQDGGSGGGAGGTIWLAGREISFVSGISASGGAGFTPPDSQGGRGGDGSFGIICADAKDISGTTIPNYTPRYYPVGKGQRISMPQYPASYRSSVTDTASKIVVSSISWNPSSQPTGTNLAVSVRVSSHPFSINSSTPSWLTVTNGQTLNWHGRYIQYQSTFTTTNSTTTPRLEDISIAYRVKPWQEKSVTRTALNSFGFGGGESWTWQVPVKGGTLVTISAYIRYNTEYSGGIYDKPKLTLSGLGINESISATSSAENSWELRQLSGTPSGDGILTLRAEGFSVNPGGKFFIDDINISQ